MRAKALPLLLLTLLLPRPADACSAMMKTNGQGTFVGRTTDFFGPVKSRLVVIPAGLAMRDPITGFGWKGKYGLVAIEVLGGLGDGVNEKGLSAHVLLQEDATFPEGAPDEKTLSPYSAVSYVLTNAASVKEAVAVLKASRFVSVPMQYEGKTIPGTQPHMALFDASGGAAIVEFNDGKLEVFEGPRYTVMTNAPNLREQLANLEKVRAEKRQYSISNLPGGAESKNRFVRATFAMENMPEPSSALQAVIYMNQAVNDVAVPAYLDLTHPTSVLLSDAWETRWRVVHDLKNRRMYFSDDQTGKRLNLDLRKVDFRGSKIRYIDVGEGKSDYRM